MRVHRLGRVPLLIVGVGVMVALAITAVTTDVLDPHPAAPTASTPAVPVPKEATAASLRSGHWVIGPRSPVGSRPSATLTWTGSEVLAIGGLPKQDFAYDNAAYNPVTHAWRRLARAPVDIGQGDGPQVWLGDRLFVFPGAFPLGVKGVYAARALLYDPGTDTWTATSPSPLGPVTSPVAARVDEQVLVAGIVAGKVRGALYDPANNTWTRTEPPAPPNHAANLLSILDTPEGTLLWSRWSRAAESGVDLLELEGTWADVTANWGGNQPLYIGYAQLSGAQVLISDLNNSCDTSCPRLASAGRPAELFDPETLQVQSVFVGPLDAARPFRTWTGAAEIDINLITYGEGNTVQPPGATAIRDPVTDTWSTVKRIEVALAPRSHPVWVGTHLVTLARDGRALTFG